MPLETNIFPIHGLAGLTVDYDVFKIIGLTPGTPGYFNNLQTLVNRLSRMMQAPITTIARDGVAHIVMPTDCEKPPVVALTGTAATLQPTGERLAISFDRRCEELDGVRQRFLQFSIQSPLRHRNDLWQPRSGDAFFPKTPQKRFDNKGLDIYRGASLRVVPTNDGSWGVCVEVKTKLIRSDPLPEKPNQGLIRSLKGRSFLYRFGHNWFEVTLEGLADFDVSQPSIPEDGRVVSILDYVMRHSRKPAPDRLAKLDPSGAAIFYRTEGPAAKHAPAALCFAIEEPHTKLGARFQRESILKPHIRKAHARGFIKTYLSQFALRNVQLSVDNQPITNEGQRFPVPSFEFGNDVVATFGGRPGPEPSRRLSELGSARLALVSDDSAGFFSRTNLGRQYIVLPRSIVDSSGRKFVAALKNVVEDLYPAGGSYDPEVIVYDDITARRNFIDQGKAIKAALDGKQWIAGHALVMIHRIAKGARTTDPLEAMIVKDLPGIGLKASVIHTDKVRESLILTDDGEEPDYVVAEGQEKPLASYLRNVALSKVLLTSGKIPFVLASETRGDVFIGIDVKANTAAFSLIGDGGRVAHSKTWSSRQRERLTTDQVATYFAELLSLEGPHLPAAPEEIVVHRDGRVFDSEIEGLELACGKLAADGVISPNWRLTILEIKKTGPVTARFFDTDYSRGGERVFNPKIGVWLTLSGEEGFVCTTGHPYRRQGTARPLHVIRRLGDLPIQQCLQDVFDLSCLSWSSPDNGSRVPITIRLCDRVLFEDAADYDEDVLAFSGFASDRSPA
tara:strand:- start:308 stop:2677 length:2370 start_codon:yes stop_codon:yes gene_type:complete